MTEPSALNTQAERVAAAKAQVVAREQGIRAQAVKQGREAERADIFKALGVQALQDASQCAQLRQERDARPTAAEEAKAVNAAYHRGAMHWSALSLIVGAALACAAIFTMQGVIWETATQAFREQAMTGAILSAGERSLPDGR